MIVTAFSHVGARVENQDAYSVGGWSDPLVPVPRVAAARVSRPMIEPSLLIVADGMGGAAEGALASRVAVEAAVEIWRAALRHEMSGDPGVRLATAFRDANDAVRREAAKSPTWRGMGTTLVALAFDPVQETYGGASSRRGVTFANVGDSRGYHYVSVPRAFELRRAPLVQVTTDHTMVEGLVLAGHLKRAAALTHPHRHILAQAIGTAPSGDLHVDVHRVVVLPGDALLLCSDGLTGALSDDALAELLRAPGTDARALCEAAVATGASDNVTCVMVRV